MNIVDMKIGMRLALDLKTTVQGDGRDAEFERY